VHELLTIYPHEIALAQLNLLDSHDMPRFITLAGGDQSALRLAVLFQMTYPGAPCIYYGDEIGLEGGMSGPPEPARGAFPWDERRWDHDLLSFYRHVIALRHAHPALRTGEFLTLHTQGPAYAFLRRLEDDQLIVALNTDTSLRVLGLSATVSQPGPWRNLLTGAETDLSAVRLPPRTGAILERLSP
jgi:cyclomaltodextrinase